MILPPLVFPAKIQGITYVAIVNHATDAMLHPVNSLGDTRNLWLILLSKI